MKSTLLYLLALVLITSCSAPKYAYHFDHYDYGAGKKTEVTKTSKPESIIAPVEVEKLLASTNNTFVLAGTPNGEANNDNLEVRRTYTQMSKSERKVFRADVKEYIKEKKESIKAAKKSNAMDNDLKLAAIFGAVGLVALIISGDVFYILGGIAMIIGVVFFVKWLVRQ